MRKAWNFGVALVVTGLMLAVVGGCEQTPADMRGDPSSLTPGDRGLQSKDLVQMTDQMAPDLLKIQEIAGSNTKVVIVLTGIENQTGDPTQNMNIYGARIRALLNEHARNLIAFVEPQQTTAQLQTWEGTGPAPQTRLVPQYALKGVFHSLDRANSSYFLCTFQLTSIRTGEIVWEGHYEVKTLN